MLPPSVEARGVQPREGDAREQCRWPLQFPGFRLGQRVDEGFKRAVRLALFVIGWQLACGLPSAPAMVLTQHALSPHGGLQFSQAAPPPPAPVAPNASHITGTVLKYSSWPPGSLGEMNPPAPSDRTLYSLVVQIHTSEPEDARTDSLARPGSTIEVFSGSAGFAANLVGKNIEATVKLTGDTRGVRWWASNVSALP